jgi:glycosyltransferase involved in cell wall biosynthesis
MIPLLVRRLYPLADAIVSVSQQAAEDLATTARIPRDRIKCIYNPVVDAGFHKREIAELRDTWFCPGAPPVILGVGRLATEKDFATLMKAFALLRNRRLAHLMILGDGAERPRLAALAKQLRCEGDVRLEGYVENPLPYMRKASVFVLSSQWEGFGNVVVEALACGTPVVSTDCPGGPGEILAGGAFGRLVPVGDPDALASAISLTLDEEPRRVALRRRGREFSVEKAAEKYLGLLIDES